MQFFILIGLIIGIYFGYSSYGIGGAILGAGVGGVLARIALVNLVVFAPFIGIFLVIWGIASFWNVG
ncbi:hypothetical protein JHD46_00585 [Sulfurimonas sp. SAG-AH-194-C20]|nr:hypothetical protein [Sulfurimonas sp. SAG-AH-194-C20]MDF1878128.1 hypothetical protein [Sulfurimonas sp. SAG-AH-194-C20]